MSTAYLARWSGPVTQQDAAGPSPSAVKHVQAVAWLSTDAGDIKWGVHNHGAVYCTYHDQQSIFNRSTWAYYSGAQHREPNHAVAIVGWDDNYSAASFSITPPGNGAWIVRNSYGTAWGEQGYFYLSYYEPSLSDVTLFHNAEPVTNYRRIYQHDPLGAVGKMGYQDTSRPFWMANVFTAEQSEELAAISFYAMDSVGTYECRIYRGVDIAPSSGDLVTSFFGSLENAGYRTVRLPAPVSISAGERFSVVLKLTTPGHPHPAAIEKAVAGYSGGATAAPGQSFFGPDGDQWTDLHSQDPTANFCIKAFTAAPAHEVKIDTAPTGTPNPVAPGGEVACSVTASCSHGHALAYSWLVEADAGSMTGANSASPKWTAPQQPGSYTITVTVTCAEDTSVGASASYAQRVMAEGTHTFRAGLQMVSLPWRPSDPDPAQLGFDDGKWARWSPAAGRHVLYSDDPNRFTHFDPAENVPGKGYWALFSRDTDVNVPGSPSSDDACAVQLPAGWSQIGNPRAFDHPWIVSGEGALRVRRGAELKTLAEARVAGWCEDFAWAYRADSSDELVHDSSIGNRDRLTPWEGYWFRAYEPIELIFPPAAEVSSASHGPQVESERGWTLRLFATLDDGPSAGAVVGEAVQSRQIELPPSLGSLRLSIIEDGRRLGVDLRESVERAVWPLEVVAGHDARAANAPVTLTWPDLSGVPNEYRPVLVDTATGKRICMRTSVGYGYTAGAVGEARRFEVRTTPSASRELMLTAATASVTGVGTVELRVTLSAAAALDAEVLNIAGRQVGTICHGRQVDEGMETLLWDAVGDRGTRLPGGMYLIRLTARTQDGRQATAVAPLQLGR